MAIDMQDPMAVLEDEMTRANEQKGGSVFFFKINDNEKALIRPLLNMRDYVMLQYHELFNVATKKYDVSAVCAVSFEQECQHCKDAINHPDKRIGKKFSAHRRFYLPVYIHSVLKRDGASQKWVPVTYTNQNDEEQPVNGVRILDMKAGSSILSDLVAAYNEAESHDITKFDFRIERTLGKNGFPSYTTTLSPNDPRTLPDDLPKQSREKIKSDVEMARPMRAVGAPVVAQSNGKAVENDIPDF